jgi:hypothetical protein
MASASPPGTINTDGICGTRPGDDGSFERIPLFVTGAGAHIQQRRHLADDDRRTVPPARSAHPARVMVKTDGFVGLPVYVVSLETDAEV